MPGRDQRGAGCHGGEPTEVTAQARVRASVGALGKGRGPWAMRGVLFLSKVRSKAKNTRQDMNF